MLALLVDLVVAVLLVRFTVPGTKRMLLGLLGGWLAAIVEAIGIGLAFGWMPIDIIWRLTIGLLIHPLLIAGMIWLLQKFIGRGRKAGPPA